MDRILPIDLERAQLRKSFRGYARKEVDTLLSGAADSMQQLLVENDRMRQEIEHLKVEVERVRQLESTIKDTLVLAQRAADDSKEAARREADAAIENARQIAVQERSQSQQQLSELKWELERLRIEKSRFTEEFRAMLERYQRELGPPALVVVDGDAMNA
jgi:cell division initiation protein